MAKKTAPARYMIYLLAAYFVAWTISYMFVIYSAVNRLNFDLYFNWFVLAWTFQGMEMVAFAWHLSLILFVPLAAGSVYLARRVPRSW
jgi:hypothetical protein